MKKLFTYDISGLPIFVYVIASTEDEALIIVKNWLIDNNIEVENRVYDRIDSGLLTNYPKLAKFAINFLNK